MKSKKDGVIVDYRTDKDIIASLESLELEVILSNKNESVLPALWGHPDMQICKCIDNAFVVCPDCYDYYKNELYRFGVDVYKGKTYLNSNYPQDIAYNVARIGDTAVHNFSYTDSEIIHLLKANNIKFINVSQGYSKCNICVVSDSAIITSDKGIYNAVIKEGIDALLIADGDIDIYDWEYGFIGGASGKIGDNILAFCGDLSIHNNFDEIQTFCEKFNVKCVSLSDKRLMDIGSVIYVKNQFV